MASSSSLAARSLPLAGRYGPGNRTRLEAVETTMDGLPITAGSVGFPARCASGSLGSSGPLPSTPSGPVLLTVLRPSRAPPRTSEPGGSFDRRAAGARVASRRTRSARGTGQRSRTRSKGPGRRWQAPRRGLEGQGTSRSRFLRQALAPQAAEPRQGEEGRSTEGRRALSGGDGRSSRDPRRSVRRAPLPRS